MNNLKQIQHFLRVAELNSFKQAAKKLFVSTTAVSKQIQNLESQLNEQLFIRTTRSVALTEFGEQYYQLCKKLEKSSQELDDFTQSKKMEPEGHLKVLAQNSVARRWVVDRLKEFNNKFPKITLEIEFSDRELDIEKENIDVMIGFTQLPGLTDNLKFKKVLSSPHVICASPNFIKQYGAPRTPHDLVHFKQICPTLRVPDNLLILGNGEKYLLASPIVKMTSFEALGEACCQGVGLLITGELFVKEKIESGELIQLLPELPYRVFDLHIFYRAMTYEQSKIRAFVDFYAEV